MIGRRLNRFLTTVLDVYMRKVSGALLLALGLGHAIVGVIGGLGYIDGILGGGFFVPRNGTLGGIRTHDLCLRRAAL